MQIQYLLSLYNGLNGEYLTVIKAKTILCIKVVIVRCMILRNIRMILWLLVKNLWFILCIIICIIMIRLLAHRLDSWRNYWLFYYIIADYVSRLVNIIIGAIDEWNLQLNTNWSIFWSSDFGSITIFFDHM